MYHSLNDELLQRTGSTVPLTEYVSLRSELQTITLRKTKSIDCKAFDRTSFKEKKMET